MLNKVENIVAIKEKLLIKSNFIFGYNVFKSHLLLLLQNASAGGKGLIKKTILRNIIQHLRELSVYFHTVFKLLWTKEKIHVLSNFYVSQDVFKSWLQWWYWKSSLSGKCINYHFIHAVCFWHLCRSLRLILSNIQHIWTRQL